MFFDIIFLYFWKNTVLSLEHSFHTGCVTGMFSHTGKEIDWCTDRYPIYRPSVSLKSLIQLVCPAFPLLCYSGPKLKSTTSILRKPCFLIFISFWFSSLDRDLCGELLAFLSLTEFIGVPLLTSTVRTFGILFLCFQSLLEDILPLDQN